MTDATLINSEPTPRVLGLARSHDQLVDHLRERKDALQISDLVCDELAQLADGHSQKILGLSRLRGLGRVALDGLMDALGVSLLIIEDLDKVRRMERRYEQRNQYHVRKPRLTPALLDQARIEIFRELGKRGAAARNSALSAEKKALLSRRAARAKHRKRRVEAAA